MKHLLRFEELGMFFLGIFAFSRFDYEWWIFAALFFVPDLGMLGYLAGKRTGAFFYNILHHKGLAIMLFLAGIFLKLPYLQLCGVMLFTHASFDRMFGYGLKYQDGFGFTHLGKIGPEARRESSL